MFTDWSASVSTQQAAGSAGRLICGLNKFDHISRVLCDRLHCLPVEQRIQYKLCLLVYKAQCGLASQYLVDFCQLSVAEADYDRPRAVTSSLSELSSRRTFFRRAALLARNQLTEKIRNLQSLQSRFTCSATSAALPDTDKQDTDTDIVSSDCGHFAPL